MSKTQPQTIPTSFSRSSLPDPDAAVHAASAAGQEPEPYKGESDTGTKPAPKQARATVTVVATHSAPYTDAHAQAALRCMVALWRTLETQDAGAVDPAA